MAKEALPTNVGAGDFFTTGETGGGVSIPMGEGGPAGSAPIVIGDGSGALARETTVPPPPTTIIDTDSDDVARPPVADPMTAPLLRGGNSTTFNVNGITVTVSPHYLPVITGAICTLVNGTTLSFSRNVKNVTLTIYGFLRGRLTAVSESGQALAVHEMRADDVLTTYSFPNDGIRQIVINEVDVVGIHRYRYPLMGLTLETGTTGPTTGGGTTTTTPINLANFLQLSRNSIQREYIKNSMVNIQSETFSAKNLATNIELDVKFSGASGVSFEPSLFTLLPNETKNVTVLFDVAHVNVLSEGISRVNCVVDVSSRTIIHNPPPPPVVPPIIPAPPMIVEPIIIAEPVRPPLIIPPPPEPPIMVQPPIIEVIQPIETVREVEPEPIVIIPNPVIDEPKPSGILSIIKRKFFNDIV